MKPSPEGGSRRCGVRSRGRPDAAVALCLVLGMVAAAPETRAEAGGTKEIPSLEYRLKAAFLYHFIEFVEWPPQAFAREDSPVVICIIGKDPFGDVLEQTVRGKTIKGRKLVIVRGGADAAGMDCQVLFISRSEAKRLDQILAGVSNRHMLTVGETDHFAERGGIINFSEEKNRVRFEVNVEAAARAGLVISSRLLSLAKTVLPSRPGQGG